MKNKTWKLALALALTAMFSVAAQTETFAQGRGGQRPPTLNAASFHLTLNKVSVRIVRIRRMPTNGKTDREGRIAPEATAIVRKARSRATNFC